MTRQIAFDTETTGLDPKSGHRIIEMGCVELINRRATGKTFHTYLQPDREIDSGAVAVHGITNHFLKDKPRIADVIDDFIQFIDGAELIIHNAPFDVGFVNHELKQLGKKYGQLEDYCSIFDTLVMARQLHPGQKNNLDALCKRYEIQNSHRTLHGALLDAEILVDVYLAMTGGQGKMTFNVAEPEPVFAVHSEGQLQNIKQGAMPIAVIRASEVECREHEEYLKRLEQ